MALLGGLAEPLQRLHVILRHTLPGGVHDADVVLAVGKTLLGGLAEPRQRLRVILRYAPAVKVHDPEVVLGGGMALVGQRTKKPKRRRIVATIVGGHPVLKRPCGYRSG